MLNEVLEALHKKRMQAIEALEKIQDIATKVSTHTDDSVPEELKTRDMARRYYGVIRDDVFEYNAQHKAAIRIALEIQKRLGEHKIRDFRDNPDALNRMRNEIDDVFFEVIDEMDLQIPLEVQDALIDKCIEITIANED